MPGMPFQCHHVNWLYWRLLFFDPSLKGRQVLTLRDGDDDGLVLALVDEVVLQLHPQHASL